MRKRKVLSEYFEVTWEDPNLLSGKSVAELLGMLSRFVHSNGVIVSNFIGRGEAVPNMRGTKGKGKFFDIATLTSLLQSILQIEWCDFFLVSYKEGIEEEFPDSGPYEGLIPKSLCTIRPVDGHLFMIYTNDERVVEALRTRYEDIEVQVVRLHELKFPF